MPHVLPDHAKRRAVRALERRFGASLMPYAFRPEDGAWRVVDVESGSWIHFTFARNRLVVLCEHDGAALA
jgi:hypothetical protein